MKVSQGLCALIERPFTAAEILLPCGVACRGNSWARRRKASTASCGSVSIVLSSWATLSPRPRFSFQPKVQAFECIRASLLSFAGATEIRLRSRLTPDYPRIQPDPGGVPDQTQYQQHASRSTCQQFSATGLVGWFAQVASGAC